MSRRAFLFVMDSVGVGGAPDAADYGDAGADTVGHIADWRAAAGRPLTLPHLDALGLGAAATASTGRRPPGLSVRGGIWGVGREASKGKDTTSGHWELAGLPVPFDWGYFPREIPCFPADLMAALAKEAGVGGFLGQKHSNGMAIIEECAEEHLRTGDPIAYTSADSVFQIAAHEETFGLDRLYEVCAIARRLLEPMRIGRVIARPFIGAAGAYTRTANRRDYAVPPPAPTLCDRVERAGGKTIGIGKIGDIFAGKGVSETRKGPDDMALFTRAVEAMEGAAPGDFVFANFVEFDSLYGHMRDTEGYAAALERFDARVPEALAALREGDLLIVTADHGNDPTWAGTDHTREQVPVLCAGPGLAAKDLGMVGYADVGETIANWLNLPPGRYGKAFL